MFCIMAHGDHICYATPRNYQWLLNVTPQGWLILKYNLEKVALIEMTSNIAS